MGATNAKQEGREDPLSPEERAALQATFQRAAGKADYAKLEKLEAEWQTRASPELLKLVLAHLGSKPISLERLATLLVHAVRGSLDERAALVVSLASGGGQTATGSQVVAVVDAVVASFLQAAGGGWAKLEEGPTRLLAAGLCHDLLHPGRHSKETLLEDDKDGTSITEAEAVKWLGVAPAGLISMQAAAFKRLLLGEAGRPLPLCKGLKDGKASILDQAGVSFLAAALPEDFRKEWRFLFSSAIHGESFSKMLGSVIWQGPTLVVVADTKGHVFGGFAVESWNTGPKFVGDNRCFLFNLRPKMAIYPTTGYNDHYQYLNVQQTTMPNGLGMGGQLGYMGFFLDSSYGQGFCSESCTTYHSPMMSASKEFEISHLEVWAVGPPPPPPEELGERPSVLDLDNEAKAILAMAGKEQKSDGWREPEEPE